MRNINMLLLALISLLLGVQAYNTDHFEPADSTIARLFTETGTVAYKGSLYTCDKTNEHARPHPKGHGVMCCPQEMEKVHAMRYHMQERTFYDFCDRAIPVESGFALFFGHLGNASDTDNPMDWDRVQYIGEDEAQDSRGQCLEVMATLDHYCWNEKINAHDWNYWSRKQREGIGMKVDEPYRAFALIGDGEGKDFVYSLGFDGNLMKEAKSKEQKKIMVHQ